LIYKGGEDHLPANFRPIALTSFVGKLFHKIIALRLEQFALENNIIDARLQKGFLTDINGTMEHIFSGPCQLLFKMLSNTACPLL
jgi:hypothetical protein